MKPHEERVVVEKKELDEKITRLKDFIAGKVFEALPSVDGFLLRQQCWAMERYSKILSQRIARFQ